MSTPPDPRPARNLRRWIESGQPRQWVASRCGTWDHHDWLMLLANLRHSEFWPLNPDAVGTVLERMKAERVNLRRWQDSEHGRRWVEARQGKWDHGDWLRLMDELRDSDFWPLHPEAVGRALEGYRAKWRALRLRELKENSRRLWRWQDPVGRVPGFACTGDGGTMRTGWRCWRTSSVRTTGRWMPRRSAASLKDSRRSLPRKRMSSCRSRAQRGQRAARREPPRAGRVLLLNGRQPDTDCRTALERRGLRGVRVQIPRLPLLP